MKWRIFSLYVLHDNGPISIRRIKKIISYDTEQGLSNILAFLNLADIEVALAN